MENIPGITKIEVYPVDGVSINVEKKGEAKFSIKTSRVGIQELFESSLEFFSFQKIDITIPYILFITTVSGNIYMLGSKGDPSPVITAEYRDGSTTDYKGWEYKVKHRSVVNPLL